MHNNPLITEVKRIQDYIDHTDIVTIAYIMLAEGDTEALQEHINQYKKRAGL